MHKYQKVGIPSLPQLHCPHKLLCYVSDVTTADVRIGRTTASSPHDLLLSFLRNLVLLANRGHLVGTPLQTPQVL